MKRVLLPCIVILGFVLFLAACGDDDNENGTADRFDDRPELQNGNGDNGNGNGNGNGVETPAADEPALEGTVVPFADGCQKSDETQFPNGPDVLIDTSRTYTATITLEKGGDIELELFSDVPITTNNFVFLACKGFYDGVTFHRVIPGFVAQGGDPTGSGSGGPGYAIPDEDDGDHGMEAGVISMAKAGPNTTGSQFFITYTPQEQLEPDFTVFGRVTSGMEVVESITPRDPSRNPNAPPGDVIASVTITES